MPDQLSVLCVHGIGHGDSDPSLVTSWTDAITQDLQRWNPNLAVTCDFLRYDSFFDHAPLNLATYAKAFAKLLASGVIHGIGDLVPGARGLFDLPEQIRSTAGMIAQWASEDDLRKTLRDQILSTLRSKTYDVVCAHSLGSLICYDTFRRTSGTVTNTVFVTLGSQIGNPFVRDCFAGRIEPVDAKMWYHLYNPDDHVLTADLTFQVPNFTEIRTPFDKPNDIINHDALWYFNHANTQAQVWREISGARSARAMTRDLRVARMVTVRPERRALLVGINEYPDPANRLEGCINDVFLMSAVLQECGFDPDDIRVVLDDRATTANILDRFHWLLDDLDDRSQRVLFYSGHGAQIPAYDVKGEPDHLDECLVPYDFDWSPDHAITDKQLVKFYSQLPYDSRFLAVFDCCHSGGLTREGRRARGIDPPDDIRHRALQWNLELGMWEDRPLPSPNPSLAQSRDGQMYLGARRATYRLGRGVALRGLPNAQYDRERKALRHKGPYFPIIFQACQEQQLSYEYRDGATSYGAFTFCMAKVLREERAAGRNPTYPKLVQLAGARLKKLRYDQTPCVVGPDRVLKQAIPWVRSQRGRRAREGGSSAARRASSGRGKGTGR